MTDAACQFVGGDIWFPEPQQARARAVRICETCPVQSDCLDYAIRNGETQGIWGGRYGRELTRMRRDLREQSFDTQKP